MVGKGAIAIIVIEGAYTLNFSLQIYYMRVWKQPDSNFSAHERNALQMCAAMAVTVFVSAIVWAGLVSIHILYILLYIYYIYIYYIYMYVYTLYVCLYI